MRDDGDILTEGSPAPADGARFGQWLRVRRSRALLTQEELAARAGVSVRTVQMIESGRGGVPRSATRRRILAALPAAGSGARETARSTGRPVPAQLPRDTPVFVGRANELRQLDLLLSGGEAGNEAAGEAGSGAGAADTPAMLISGAAGVGKTALAVRWAHQVAHVFPDGQLYVDLRGYDHDRPMSSEAALGTFLRALDVSGSEQAEDPAELAGRYRTLLAGRRMLVVLDNACEADQVRPLLPGSGSCFVVVTSRETLPGLVARDGVGRIMLDLLPRRDAVRLLGRLTDERVAADPVAAAALADRCACLPLALRVAAERAAARPGARLADLAAELADEQHRLDLLDGGGDRKTAVRAVFSWSFRHLPADQVRAFGRLGLHPGREIDRYACAALLGTGPAQARQVLGALTAAQLVRQADGGRYGMHDLLWVYAAERVLQEPEPDRIAALTRLLDYYQATVAAAADLLYPYDRDLRPPLPPAPVAPMSEPRDARHWLDGEFSNLVEVVAFASAMGWPGHAVRIAAMLWRYLDSGFWTDAVSVHSSALAASRRMADRVAEARALNLLGFTYWRLGRCGAALRRLRQALAIQRDLGDSAGEALTLNHLAGVHWQQGDSSAAVHGLQQAIALHRVAGNREGEAAALVNLGILCGQLGHYGRAYDYLQLGLEQIREMTDGGLDPITMASIGIVHCKLGRYEEAGRCLHIALDLAREQGDRMAEADTLDNLGSLSLALGDVTQAEEYFAAALPIAETISNRAGLAQLLDNMGLVRQRQGRAEEAVDYHRRAHDAFQQVGDRRYQPKVFNGLGEALNLCNRPDEALGAHRTALHLAIRFDNQHERARALEGAGLAMLRLNRSGEARQCLCEAHDIYVKLNVPEVARLASRLEEPAE